MLDITLNWKPNPHTLANQQQKPLEALLDEAVLQYFQLQEKEILSVDDDPIVGFYAGSPDLGTNAEDILAAAIQPNSAKPSHDLSLNRNRRSHPTNSRYK